MKQVFLVHGFNDRTEGKFSIDLLTSDLKTRGYEVIQADYGWTGRIGVRICNKKISSVLAHFSSPGDIAIGHSNGCAILHEATHHADNPALFSHLIYINPALNSKAPIAPQVKRLDVFHDPTDFWPRIASWIPFDLWGAMGSVGYRGGSEKGHNHEHHWGHSGLPKREPHRILNLIGKVR